VGAGPIEGFLSNDEDDLQWLEQQAALVPKLRVALSHACVDWHVSDETMRRLERLARSSLTRW
jgi:hypothetical protein